MLLSNGYSGLNYDRHVEHQDNTTIGKVKEKYWLAKQTFRQKLGKKDDDCVVASDTNYDIKLELFKSISISGLDILQVVEDFQENVSILADFENKFGKFMQEKSRKDKTKLGKLFLLFGKSQILTAHYRIQLHGPLQRIYDDMYVFQERAIKDCLLTIEKAQNARNNYRAALLWMKDVSQKLDPDTYKQLENFRKVQSQVKRKKVRFDKLKNDSSQKIDLLMASRCNLISTVFSQYQKFLVKYHATIFNLYGKVLSNFDGYQLYEFSRLKDLTDISRKLAQELAPDPDGRQTIDVRDEDLLALKYIENGTDAIELQQKNDHQKEVNKTDEKNDISASNEELNKSSKTQMDLLITGLTEDEPLLENMSTNNKYIEQLMQLDLGFDDNNHNNTNVNSGINSKDSTAPPLKSTNEDRLAQKIASHFANTSISDGLNGKDYDDEFTQFTNEQNEAKVENNNKKQPANYSFLEDSESETPDNMFDICNNDYMNDLNSSQLDNKENSRPTILPTSLEMLGPSNNDSTLMNVKKETSKNTTTMDFMIEHGLLTEVENEGNSDKDSYSGINLRDLENYMPSALLESHLNRHFATKDSVPTDKDTKPTNIPGLINEDWDSSFFNTELSNNVNVEQIYKSSLNDFDFSNKGLLEKSTDLKQINDKNAPLINNNKNKPEKAKDMSNNAKWLEKFAEIDPLSNPDLMKYFENDQHMGDRNC